MNKVEKGKARAEKLTAVIDNILSQDNNGLKRLLETGFIEKTGKISRSKLANAVGLNCEPATFRQNNAMKEIINDAEKAIKERDILLYKNEHTVAKTKEVIGIENESHFLAWLTVVGTKETPAPVNHYDRLYKKALWAQYSEQSLLDVKRTPTWFNSRPKVKEALEELDVKVVQGSVITQKMDAESLADDMENSMTSALVSKLRAENKELKEKLECEINARKEAELKAEQNALLASQATTGKMARQ